MGRIRERLGDLGKALECHREALRLDPRSAEVHYQLGVTCDRNGMVAEAEREFVKALGEDAPLYRDVLTSYALEQKSGKTVSSDNLAIDEDVLGGKADQKGQAVKGGKGGK